MSKKINLRKASSIQKEIQNYLTDLELSTEIKVPLSLDAAEQLIGASQDSLLIQIHKTSRLYDILANIRNSVSEANTTSGISKLLGQEILIKNKMKLWEKVKSGSLVHSTIVLTTMIEKAANRSDSENSYYNGRGGSSYEVNTGILTEESKKLALDNITSLKRQRNKVNETILALNVKTEITIDDEDYTFLELLGIV